MPKPSICIKTSKKHGQKIIALASKLEIIDKSLEIERDQDSLSIPIMKQLQESELAKLKGEASESTIVNSCV